MQLDAIDYSWGLYPSERKVDVRKAKKHLRFDGSAIPREICESFERERIHEFHGAFGTGGVGSPAEVDTLTYRVSGEERHVLVVNRTITMFASNDDEISRLHRFFCTIQQTARKQDA